MQGARVAGERDGPECCAAGRVLRTASNDKADGGGLLVCERVAEDAASGGGADDGVDVGGDAVDQQ